MIHFLFIPFNGTSSDRIIANHDSMVIYNAYKPSIEKLQATTNPEEWYVYDDSIDHVTTYSFQRLSKFNGETYEPIEELNKEGFGVAFAYPKPGRLSAVVPSIAVAPVPKPVEEPKAASLEIAFKVLDSQTHFLVADNGKTKIPYIVMNYYAKGRILVKSEKLNPITMKPIEELPEETGKPTAMAIRTE